MIRGWAWSTGSALAALVLTLAPAAAADDGATTTTLTTNPATTVATTTTATTTAATTTSPTTTSGAAPCVGAGVLAIAPVAGAPAPTGPAVAAAERTSAQATLFDDPAGSLHAAGAEVGAAGCRDTAGTPGGTAVTTGAWSVLGGAVAGDALSADLVPVATPGSGWSLRAVVTGLRVDGRTATLDAGQTVAVGAWGVLSIQGRLDAGAGQPLRWWASALELRLTAPHAGLAAGTTLLIGYAAADRVAEAPPPAPPVSTPSSSSTTIATAPARGPKAVAPAKAKTRAPARAKAKKTRKKAKAGGLPLKLTPPLGLSVYDFPVYGQVAWGDTYGGERSDVPGGWHHGDDLFASLGRPVVAVADGTVFAVGWNGVGGWRLWLRDDAGNEFYYAHLSGYTKLARNGARVRRGQVLGFVGNTGDAFTTPDHLHFEIHPAGLLYLGYDGAVDPSTYLAHWQRPARVAKLLPVELPDRHRHGDGALSDYRQLLALHGLARGVAEAAEKLPSVPLIASKPLRLPDVRLAAPPVAAPSSGGAPGGSSRVAAGAAGGAAVLGLGCVFAVLRRRRATGGET